MAEPGPSTRSIHAGSVPGEDVVPPLRRSVITRFDTAERFGAVMAGTEEGYLYGRIASPTVRETAAAIAELEGAEGCQLTASGMAAVHAAIVTVVPNGGRLVVALQTYGNSISLFRDFLGPRLGVDVRVVDVTDLGAMRAACEGGADAIYCETIANPGSTVADLDALGELAQAAGARLVVDSTLATPLLCRPLEHGAQIVLHSATKFLNGHHDVLAGAICGLFNVRAEVEEFDDGLRVPGGQKLHGASLDSFGDHRIAMAFAVAALRAEGETEIKGADAAVISFPEFFQTLDSVVER